MLSLHENRGRVLFFLGLLVVGALLLAACSSGSVAVGPPPAPYPAPPAEPEIAASIPAPLAPSVPESVPPAAPPAQDPQPPFEVADVPHPSAASEAAEAYARDDWESLSLEERAARLQIEGLEFDSNRLATEFSGVEEDGREEPAEPTLLEELNETPIPEDYTLAESREGILRRTPSELPLALNAQVIKLINYFSGRRGLNTYKTTMGRGAAYQEMIERTLQEEGVPKELFHLAQAESGFRPKVRSWARATGMWQFVSFRGRQYGLRQDRYVEERYDPEKATRAAARHLKDLHIEFGDWYLAMAAYNSGPERVRRAIRRSGSRDYWTLCQRGLLPRETRNYIPIILAFTYLTKNQQLYGLGEMDPAPPLRYDTVTTSSEISFDLLADLVGTTPTTVKELNPALLRSATPPFQYDLRLPEGTVEQFLEEIAFIPEEKRASWRRHEVESGETLAAVARRYRVQEAEIAELNDLEGGALSAGLRLTIPTQTRLEHYGGSGQAGGFVEGGSGRYRIANGDTLGAISQRFGVSVQQLMAWNGLSNTRISAGRYLVIQSSDSGGSVSASSSSSSSSPNPGLTPGGRYTVRSGDNLTEIATRHRVSVSDLRAWNGLRGSTIQVGQVLRVPGSDSRQSRAAAAGGQYRIRNGDNLATIAARFGVSVKDLQAWNGLRGTRIRAGESLRVASVSQPSAPPQQRAAAPTPRAVQTAAASAPPSGERYRIRRGDNLDSIARNFNVSIDQLKGWNGLRNSRITAGEYLQIGPAAGRGGPARTTAAVTPPAAPAPSLARPAGAVVEQYRIRRGDNLADIARRFEVSVTDLQAWNGLSDHRITAGESLTIRANGASPAGQYRIRRGDTLDSIAKRFGVSIGDLRAWNDLRGSRIHEGNYLTVRPEATANQGSRKLATAGGA